MTALAFVTPDADFVSRVRASLNGDGPADPWTWRDELAHADPATLVEEVATSGTMVACLGPGLAEDYLFGLAETFDRAHPEVSVVVLAPPSPEVWQRALRTGVRDVVDPARAVEELAPAVERARETAARRRQTTVAAPKEAQPTTGRVIVVVSPKGGSGKTTIASNLAVTLARSSPTRTAAIDLDVQFGDLATALQLVPEQTMAQAARSSEIDPAALKVLLTQHGSGLFVLCAPDDPADGDDISGEQAAAVVEALAQTFPNVVVDTGAGLDETTLGAIEHATDLVFVCSMDVAGVRGLRKELDALELLHLTSNRRHLVLNRADTKVGLDVRDIETILGMRVDFALPSTRSVPMSLNQGTPIVDTDPRLPFSTQIRSLASRFVENGLPEPKLETAPRRRWRR